MAQLSLLLLPAALGRIVRGEYTEQKQQMDCRRIAILFRSHPFTVRSGPPGFHQRILGFQHLRSFELIYYFLFSVMNRIKRCIWRCVTHL